MLPSDVVTILKKLSPVYKENAKNIIIRCPYCGDSNNPRSAHLYISKNKPFPFHCFRAECESKGTIIKLLRDFNLLNQIEKSSLQELYKNGSSYDKYQINHNILDLNLSKQNDSYNYKLDYIKDRLGIDIIPEWFSRFIVTDFTEVINSVKVYNHVVKKYLNTDYIGFLTYGKNKIICRRIDDSKTFLPRYYNIQINNQTDYFLTFPNSNTKLLDSKGSIIIGEGIFDIVNGYLKLKDNFHPQNSVLISSHGKGLYPTYSFIIKKFGLVDWNLYIFADNDMKDQTIRKLFNHVPNPTFIVRNMIDKDLGSKQVDARITTL